MNENLLGVLIVSGCVFLGNLVYDIIKFAIKKAIKKN